jgi:hypothetical protein
MHHNMVLKLIFSMQPSKCQFSAAAGALFSLNGHYSTLFLGEEDVHLMGRCPVYPLMIEN